MRATPLWAAVCAIALSSSSVAVAEPSDDAATDDDPNAKAARLFDNGNKRFDAGDLTGAEAAYEEAWTIVHSFDIAANLGAVELDQGKAREAAEHFAFALSTFPVGGSADKRASLNERLDAARKDVGTLVVTLDPREATLTVDGKQPDVSPYRNWIFVAPGRHRVEATRAGFAPAEQQYVAHAGQTFEVSLVLQTAEEPSAGGAATPPPEAPDSSSEGAPMWPAFVGAGLTLALVGVGLGFTIAGSGAESDADDRRAQLTTEGVTCPGGCDELRDLYGDADSAYNTGVVFFVASGVAAAATLSYLVLMPSSSGDSRAQARVSPTFGLGPDGAGAGLLGSF